ncbi:16S rRNA (cytidine(1402)-2'-O)-methyltransferase [Aliidiomarina quisquiliarum]|uniref:16S rRNA (cytidine(1402)-2'-O)-methyltransferase n=1 Tax=Aliidiomarina quisquiliarum TaxID=2938947 RepID=UPI00208F21C8|nr:16S rRNA (cytidine(1402)-2'-O)-methyltransferase [Aliidiomarina quisquiliarum]MCO4321453.1 16S rRNA (cytidine(1402)-2'-O)-methyltransferase [Aliidiomarina quisquiliarum]
MNPGILYIVPTPIGNLADMTQRAQQVLAEVSAIAAEDTRHSRVLLDHYGIQTPMFALHEHNERQKAAALVKRLEGGDSIALISDAGTPLISDPGFPLVRACRAAGVQVVALPGPSAVITALSASGLPTDRFLYAGFLPAKQQARLTALTELLDEPATLVFYEAPRRIVDTLTAVVEVFGAERDVVVAREITKQFETYLVGTASEVLAQVQADPNQQRGEMVLIIAGAVRAADAIPAPALQLLATLSKELAPKKAAKIVAGHYGLRANELYRIGLEQA